MTSTDWRPPKLNETMWLSTTNPVALISEIYARTQNNHAYIQRRLRRYLLAMYQRVIPLLPAYWQECLMVAEQHLNFPCPKAHFQSVADFLPLSQPVTQADYLRSHAKLVAVYTAAERCDPTADGVALTAAELELWEQNRQALLAAPLFPPQLHRPIAQSLKWITWVRWAEALEEYTGQEYFGSADLLREIIGNPFRPYAFERAWLEWNQHTVFNIAASIYINLSFHELPVLADALEEAGCTAQLLLNHLREPGPHNRACWALERILQIDARRAILDAKFQSQQSESKLWG